MTTKTYCDLCREEIDIVSPSFTISIGKYSGTLFQKIANRGGSKSGHICNKCYNKLDDFIKVLKGEKNE